MSAIVTVEYPFSARQAAMAPTRRKRCASAGSPRAASPVATSSGRVGTCIWYWMVPHSLGTGWYRLLGGWPYRVPSMESAVTQNDLEHVHVAIIGSGFSGLGTAIRLKQEGMHDFVVLERANEVGGTWRDNTYPGCACDVPSNLYSFSFAPNPDWTRAFSPQPEIFEYLKACASRYGITPHIRFR